MGWATKSHYSIFEYLRKRGINGSRWTHLEEKLIANPKS
jgi:hypothetical protein